MKPRAVKIIGIALALALIALVAISVLPRYLDSSAFRSAQLAEKAAGQDCEAAMKAYQDYLRGHPQGHWATAATTKIHVDLPRRIETREWEDAVAQGTTAAYKSFLKRFPDTIRRRKAHDAMIEIAWRHAMEQDDTAAYKSFIQTHEPNDRRAREARRQLTILSSAEKEFAKGRMVYLYDPRPVAIAESETECTVRYVRRRDADVRAQLLPVYVMRSGEFYHSLSAYSKQSDRPLLARRGEASESVSTRQGLHHVELVLTRAVSRGGAVHVEELSNHVMIRYQGD